MYDSEPSPTTVYTVYRYVLDGDRVAMADSKMRVDSLYEWDLEDDDPCVKYSSFNGPSLFVSGTDRYSVLEEYQNNESAIDWAAASQGKELI